MVPEETTASRLALRLQTLRNALPRTFRALKKPTKARPRNPCGPMGPSLSEKALFFMRGFTIASEWACECHFQICSNGPQPPVVGKGISTIRPANT